MMAAERKNSRLEPERYDLESLLRRPSLRANIPRRISQVPREVKLEKEMTCGVGCIRGDWLQSFANRKTYIFVFEILGTFYGSYCAYFYGIISTLEKQFQLSSQTLGLIVTAYEIAQLMMCFLISICIPKTHKPSWITLGIFIITASTIFSTLPYFLYEPKNIMKKQMENSTYYNETSEEQHLCSNGFELCSYKKTEKNISIMIILLSQVLFGIGGSIFFTLGGSYSKDNIKMYHTSSLLSFFKILKTLGPALGYSLSSMCLKIFVLPHMAPSVDENHPRWIGAWWLGNLIISFMIFVVGAVMILFPSTLPKAAVISDLNQDLVKFSQQTERKEEKKMSFSKYMFQTSLNIRDLSEIFNSLRFIGYFIFLAKYVEIQYRQTASNANLITGSVTLICAAFGTLICSSTLIKYKPNAKTLAVWNVFVDFVSLCTLTFYIYFGCNENDEQIQNLKVQLYSNQSLDSKCEEFPFYPTCYNSKETFISPHHYTCKGIIKNKVENICQHLLLNLKEEKNLSLGVCLVECYFKFLIFTIVTCSTAFVVATGQISKLWLEMKISKKKRFNIFVLGLTLFRFIAFIPSIALFSYILDNSCLLWENDCSKNGNCWLYDSEKLRYQMNLTAVVFVLVGIVCDTGNWFLMKSFNMFDDNQQNIEFNFD